MAMGTLIGTLVGTLESFRPLMVGEKHKTWLSSYGKTMFDFIGVINGVEGIFSSTLNKPTWKPGQKVSYEQTYKEGNKYPKFTIKKLDEKTGEPAEYKDRYNDPASIRCQAYGIAIEIAIRTFQELARAVKSQDDIDKVAKYFYEWLVKEFKDRDTMYSRSKALSNSVDSIKHSALALRVEKPFGLIIALAEHYYELSIAVRKVEEVPYA